MESVAQSIVSKFGQVIVEELKEIRGLGDKVVHLRDELATMNAVLRVISEADQDYVDHIVREWENQVLDLVYDAEDCTDTYSLRIVRPIPPLTRDDVGGTPLTFWARYLFARAKHFAKYHYEKLVLQRTLAADINTLLARTTIVSERRARYDINSVALPRSTHRNHFLEASTYASANGLHHDDDPDKFVGITELANTLAWKIKAPVLDRDDHIKALVHDENDKSLKVFSIVGFGGLGKTTLAMELCQQLDVDFPYQAQVSVSQGFNVEKDMKGLLVRVLQQILKANQTYQEEEAQIDKMNVKELASKIKELLDHKRCLIVVDDVWSLPAWEAISSKLPEKNCGSRIIVTTRIEAVAKAASGYFVHHMKPLKPKASKELFMKRVFGSTEKGTCPMELKVFMDMILDKCGGYPSTIIGIASLLASYCSAKNIYMWERISISFLSHTGITFEGMRQLTEFSYDNLPRHLKACMMYLCIFPEDYVVAKDRLLYKWIAEGLVTERRGLTLWEVAEEYFNDLIGRDMIQLEKIVSRVGPYGERVEIEGCRAHGIVLEVMVSKSKQSNFVTLVGQQYRGTPHGHDKVRRLSIHDNDQGLQKVEAMKLQHTRSLTTFQHADGLGKLLDRLGEFKLLRVLDLEDCKSLQNKHMRDVCSLYLLRFLSLRGTNVSEMPRKVCNLEHLETLDIKNTHIGGTLPQTVTKLSKLERLWSNCWLLPRGIGNMKALREVDTGGLTGNDIMVAQEIGKLTQLQVLSIRIDDHVDKDFLCALASSLSNTWSLQSLNLENRGGSWEFLLGVSMVLPLLRCLSLYGNISQLPDWISSLTLLRKIEVGRTELAGDQLFGVLCKLPNLQSIQLVYIKWEHGELVARPEHSFPVLRILEVLGCPTVLTFEKGSMTKLETLVLRFVATETRIVGLENLEKLKEVKLSGWKGNPAMKRAVEQLKALSTESNPIKVVVDWS
ncbi:unnamed protein product [Triticum turgidum subsp. durum]|uniref:Uncharacterized protein n=1 Tax=Triticum turgidum subsp. durum TaxID=4567 RepID=A0A9R0Z0U5_TRITD|nr:unnamed protein product [Triticum turgidum subsp. durum]